ncbi:Hsp20/alpha crystallin family protein [uncultured Bifidobacterium sp.]|uniref:Hsp20/alpha crystallin family protein n=1 Tax=uncultured Bifidobacterium sp. TaxID=165187 RepID=UPI00261681DC|nr:Hsp20/alpha crystallin family protein [uncultured Bifidobacterium sp.]
MAMFPAVMNDTMFADLFDDPFFSGLRNAAAAESVSPTSMMSTDVRETDKSYEVAIDMPGFNKDDIAVELHDGYLSVTAHKDENHDDKDKDGKWLRRERYVGSCSRSFYVGDDVKDSDVTASYKDGTLSLSVAKVAPKAQVEDRKRIAIEG